MLVRPFILTCLFCIFAGQAALSQAPRGVSFPECDQVLNSPQLKDLLFRGDGQLYNELDSDRLGAVLLGVPCSPKQIAEYFSGAGWPSFYEEEFSTPQESGPSHQRYKYDYIIAFEKLRSFPSWLFLGQREAVASVYFFEGRVTYIEAGFSK